MAGFIEEFLVSLGWQVDNSSARKAEQTADRVADTVEEAEKRQTEATVAGAAKRKIEADREAGRRTKGAAEHIDELKRREAAEKKAAAEADRIAKAKAKADKDRAAAEAKAAKASESSTATLVKGAAATVAAIEAAAVGVTAAIVKISSGMEALYYAGQRTNSSTANLKAFNYAASQLGSTAEGAAGSLEALATNMRSSPGYEGMLKSLGVATRQNGKLRDLTDITIDLGKALGRMPHFQAKAYADALGIDERTLIALKSGEFERYIKQYQEMLGKAGLNSDQAAKDSAAFMNTWRRMWTAVEILMTRIGGALSEKFGAQIGRLTDYLLANADTIAKAVVGIGEMLLRLATRIVDIVKAFNDADPSTKKFAIQIGALAAALLLLNSGPVAALLALGSAIVFLYDDYRKWKDGSKDTFIDWDAWAPTIEKTLAALKSLWEGFDKVAQAITGQSGIVVAFEALAVVMVAKLLSPLVKVVGLLTQLGGITPAPWLLRLLGLGGLAVAGAAIANENNILGSGEGSQSWHERIARVLEPGVANRIYGQTAGGKAADAKDGRTLWQKYAPKALGGKDAPGGASEPYVPRPGDNAADATATPMDKLPKVDPSKFSANLMEGQYGGIGQNLVTIQTPGGKKFTVNKEAAPSFQRLVNDLEAQGYNISSIGGYNPRQKRNGSGWSQHAYGNAIDINPGKNAQYQQTTDMPEDKVQGMLKKYGLKWGHNWSPGSRDPMHFEWDGTRPWLDQKPTPAPAAPAGRAEPAGTAAPAAPSPGTPAKPDVEYQAYRAEMEENARKGVLPPENESDAARFDAWRKARAAVAAPAAASAGANGYRSKSPQEHFGKNVDVGKLPVGMGNNNPGNLKYFGAKQASKYPGVVGPSKNLDVDKPQIVFNSPEAGMAAMAQRIREKFAEGRDTVRKLIADQGGWTPGSLNSAGNIAKTMGVGLDDKLDLKDGGQMHRYMRALIRQEHGEASKLYSDDLIKGGIEGSKGAKVSAVVERLRTVALDTAKKVEDTLVAYPHAWLQQADASMTKVGERYEAGSQWKSDRAFASAPLGVHHSNTKSTTNTFHEGDRHITVAGVSDPKEAAGHIEGAEKRRRSELIGNFQNRFA